MALSEGEETDDIEPVEQPEFAGEISRAIGVSTVAKRPGPEMSRRWNLPRSTNCGDSVTRRAPSRATSPPCERRHPGVSWSRRGRARKCREGGTCRGRRIAGTPSRAAPRRARRRHPAKGGTRASQGRDEAGPGNVAKVELAEVDELRGLRHAPRPVARDVATLRKEAPGRLRVEM